MNARRVLAWLGCTRRCALLAAACLLMASLAGPTEARIRDKTSGKRDFISGWRRRELSPEQIESLVEMLSEGRLAAVPETLFGRTFDKNLPDLILYSPPAPESPKIVLSKNRKSCQRLYGADYVWVMAIWLREKPSRARLASDRAQSKTNESDAIARPGTELAEASDEDSVLFRLEPLTYEPDIPERSILGSLVTLVGIAGENASEDATPQAEDVFITDAPTIIGPIPNTNRELMFSMVKFRLRENSIVRIRVLRKGESLTATFGNYSATSYGVSLGANAATFLDRDTTGTRNVILKPFVYFHLYLRRPRLPLFDRTTNLRFPGSVSLVLGTETSTDFEHWYWGVGFGHVLGRLGFTLGVPLHRTTGLGDREIWVGGKSFGLFYTL